MIDEISLKPDWDYQPKLGNSRGHHITREDEHRILTDFLTRRDEGSLLVCGYRGVGKTSSIIAAINAATKDKPLIAVLMKATSINFKKDDMKKSLLQGLIRFLYKTVKDDDKIAGDLKNKTEELYDKSLASEAHDERHSGKSKTTEKTFKTRLNLGLAAFVAVFVLGSIGSIFPLNFIFDLKFEFMQHLWIFSFPIAVISGIGILTMYNSRKVITTFFSSTSSYYRHDYDFSALQSEFEDLMEEYSKNSRILFVLDEFDKIEIDDAILHMKMLINQGNALFIFITDPEYLDKIREKRSKEYTLFSQILFLKRPLFREMEAFIDDIFSINDEIKKDEGYKNFRNYLCYKSRTDFFEIHRVIRDHISGKDPSRWPSIKVSLDDAQLTKANIQKSIGWVYERKEYSNQSKQQINDEMIDALYEFVETMEDYPKPMEVTVNKNNISFSRNGVEYKKLGHDAEYKEHQMSAVKDLILLLEEQGYLGRTENQYDVTGRLSKFDAKGIFVEEQRVFKEAYDEFKENLVNFANIQSQWIEELGVPFTIDTFESKQETIIQKVGSIVDLSLYHDVKTYYDQLQSPDPPLIATETLQRHTISLRSTLDLLNRRSMNLLARILEKQLGAPYTMSSDTSTAFFTLIGMQGQNVPNAVLELQKKSKGIKNIVITYSPQVDFLKSVKEKRIQYNNMIICLGGRDRFSDYGKNSFIIDDAGVLEKEIDGFFNSTNTDQFDSGSIPEKDPELKDGEHRTFFFVTSLPLDLGVIKKLLGIIRKYSTANQL